MKRKTWLIREAAQSRKCCWSIAYRLNTLNTHFAAHILGWRDLSQTQAAYLQSGQRQEEVMCAQQPHVSWRSGLTYGGEGDKEQRSVKFSVKSCSTPLSSSPDLFFLFSPSFVCTLYMHFSRCSFCAFCDLAVAAYIPSAGTATLLISLHLTVGFSWLKIPSGSNTSPEQVN